MPFPIDEEFVRQAEEKLGASLPQSYRISMIAENGGDIASEFEDWRLFPILDSSDRKRISRTCNDIIAETKSASVWSTFPQQALAIAEDGTGDRLVFLRSGSLFGPEVYHWFHETGELAKIADDFSEPAIVRLR